MCGIAGYLSRRAIDPGILAAMGGSLAHRGPDDGGTWIDHEAGVGLAHRRLSIVDLSPAGRQPMRSADGRWVLDYNGEIYNHRAIRSALEADGQAPEGGWRGHSDSETLVQAIAAWGLHRALAQAVGMFAIALWDRRDRQLQLIRDRFGEKPLYYGWCGRDFVFASELKAVRVHLDFRAHIDRQALAALAALTVIPAPLSIYSGIKKLRPGHVLTIDASRLEEREGAETTEAYWSYADVVEEGQRSLFSSEDEALEALDDALRGAVAGTAMADVPVGAFLSGGVDSSTVVALTQAVTGRQVRTYSIGFDEPGFDESADARRVAEHLQTDHHEHRIGVAEAQAVIPLLPTIYDEPFADSSQIPTYLVSKFARADVTVAISGDGGDELFGGYNRHRLAPDLWRRLKRIPEPMRRWGGMMSTMVPASAWERGGRLATGRGGVGAKVAKAARIAGDARSLDDVYSSFLDEWFGEPSPVLGTTSALWWSADLPTADDLARMTYADAVGYLPDDILTKVDRASMAVSLESRVPMLDHRVAAVAARIPSSMKVRNGTGKHILRELLYRHVPKDLIDRPKAGFAVPVGEWIRGPLRDWAEALLTPERLSDHFDAERIRRRWHGHIEGRRDSTPALWAILMFEAWREDQDGA